MKGTLDMGAEYKEYIQSYPPLLTRRDLEAILEVSKPTALKLVREAEKYNYFPVKRLGPSRIIRVPRDAFFDWLGSY